MRMMPRSPSCSTWQEVHCVAFAWNCVDCFVPKSVPAWQVRQVRVSTPLPGVWQAVHWPAKNWCALESGPGETSCAIRPASLGASDRIRIATAATITSRAAMKTA